MKLREPQVGQKLSFVNGVEGLHCLHLDNDALLDDEVHPVSRAYLDTFVLDGKLDLSLASDVPQREFLAKAGFISRLQEAGPEHPMHFNRRADDPFGQL